MGPRGAFGVMAAGFAILFLTGLAFLGWSSRTAAGLLQALLFAIAFAIAAMRSRESVERCDACRRPVMPGLGFCGACGVPRAPAGRGPAA